MVNRPSNYSGNSASRNCPGKRQADKRVPVPWRLDENSFWPQFLLAWVRPSFWQDFYCAVTSPLVITDKIKATVEARSWKHSQTRNPIPSVKMMKPCKNRTFFLFFVIFHPSGDFVSYRHLSCQSSSAETPKHINHKSMFLSYSLRLIRARNGFLNSFPYSQIERTPVPFTFIEALLLQFEKYWFYNIQILQY